MTSSRKFERLLQAGCLGLIGMLAAAGCGGSSGPEKTKDAGDGGVSTPEVGGGSGALLTVNPPSIDFQTIDVGVKSAPMTVTVTNAGTAASLPLAVTVSGTGITATGCSGQTLAKNATCTISVTAQVAAAGQFTGTIEVGDTALNTRKISVSGIAVPQGQFSLTPAPFDLGPVVAGKTATGTVVLANTGTTGLTGIVINVSGTGFVAGTGTCTEALAVGTTCNIVINFTAGATSGPAKGTLTVSQGGVTKSAALTAMVQTPAKLVMTPPSAALQTVLGTPSQPATFYVTNAGNLASAVPTVTITGTNKDDFKAESTCVTALAGDATASCQISVVYNPKTAPTTNSTATLTVSEGAAGSSVTAALTGTAVPPSTLAISGTPVDLGEVVVGNTGAASTFTVTNNGGENSGVVEVTAAPAQFVIVANTCADKDLTPKGTPAATNTCTFTVAFKPAAGDVGVIAGQLKAKGATTLNPAFLAVSGKAVPAAKLAIEPQRLEFGALPTAQESAPLTLVVSNQGGAPTGALKVENTGAQFKIKGDTCSGASLTAAGATASCSIVVTFTSTGTDVEATGSIIVTDTTGAAGSVTATLHGTGTKHAGLAMVPSVVCPQYNADDPLCYASQVAITDTRVQANQWNFENKVVGQATAEKTIKVYNLTDPTLAPDSGAMKFEITGDAKGDFKIVQNNCTTLLSTTLGTSCVLTVTFTPGAVGLRKATLVLSTDRGGASQTTLEGKGLAAVELQPLAISKTVTGLDFGGVALGHNGGLTTMRPYRVWVRDTTAADHTSTVTVTLPTPSLPDFVWPTTAPTLTIKNGDNLLTPTLGHDGGAFVASPATAPAVANDTFPASASSNPCNNRTLDLSMAGAAGTTQNGYTKADGYWFCDFGVQFFPQSAKGDLSAELNASATGGGTSKLTLTGKSTGPLVVTSVPENFILEPVAVGMSSTITLTITNQGTTSQTNLTFALSGTGAADFQITGTTCWGAPTAYVAPTHAYTDLPAVTLLPEHDCKVTLGFTPQTEDKYSVVFSATAANGAGTTDDEVGTGTLTSAGSKKYGTLTVTPTSATTLFGDVAAGSTTAPAVTFTVTNTGTLNATNLHIEKKGTTAHFEVLPSTGVSGACNYENSSFILQGGVPCTVRIRPLPVAGDAPTGVEKKQVDDKYVFSAEFSGQTVGVEVPVSYYVTSNIVVKDTGASSTSIAYEFAAAGQNAKVTHDFVVTNIGSTVANLATSVPSPFEVIAAGDGLTPPACTYGSATLAAGASCTLRLRNLNTTISTVVPTDGGALKISDGATATYYAQVLLSSTTLQPSTLVNLEPTAGATINLGTVPISSSTASFAGGVAKVWFKNTGKVQTEALNFRWDNGSTLGTAGTADPEFIIDSDETSCVNKALQPDATCSMSVHFTPNYAQRASKTARTLTLNLTNGGVDTFVVFTAKPSDTASLYFEDVAAGKDGFSQFPGSTALTALSTARTFRITNASDTAVTLNLPAAGAVLAGDFVLAATQPTGSCTLGAAQTLSTATTTSCTIDVQFKAPATMPAGNISKTVYEIAATGPTTVDKTYAALGLMARVQQPVALTITQTPSSVAAIGVGASTTLSLTVVNTGDVAMTGDPLTTELVAGVAAATFAISADGCVGKRLAAGGSCVVGVTATGASLGSGTATLNVAIGTSITPKLMTVPVQNAAAISFKSGSGTFGSVPVTGMSADRTFVIQNAASAVRTGKVTAALTGTNADQFSIVGSTCLESGLAAAGECNVVVRFAPTALSTGDDFTATLTVTATPGGSKTMTLLGTPVSALAIDPSVATGSVAVGADAGKAFRVTLRDSATPTAPLKTSLTGTDFMMVDDECYGQILSSANTSCVISVKYIGTTSSTAKTTTLTVNGGSTAKTVSVSVSATNVQANTI